MKYVPLVLVLLAVACYVIGLFTWKPRWWVGTVVLGVAAIVLSIGLNLLR